MKNGDSAWWSDPRVVVPVVILAATFGVYAATLRYQFVYDDAGIIVNNPLVQSWQSVPRYFTEHVWSYMFPDVPGNYYRPVFLLWLRFNHWLFGLEPFGWHLTTVLAHTGVTFLVYLLAKRITGDLMAAAVSGLVFGLHPAHIESVAWISGVTEPLVALFFISSLLCYQKWRSESRQRGWLALSLSLFALALLSKETAILLPLIVFASEMLLGEQPEQSGRSWFARAKPAALRLIPFLVLLSVYLTARVAVLKGLGHSVTALPLSTVAYTLPSVGYFYIQSLLWPVGLSAFYDTPYVTQPTALNFVLPLAVVIVVAAALWWISRRSKAALLAVVLLILPVLPLLNISVFPESEIAHDRYLYLPSVGLAVLIGLGASRLGALRPQSAKLAAGALAGLLAVGTISQQGQWASNFDLYSRSVEVAAGNNIATNNLANELLARGDYDQAIRLYQRVIERKPNFWLANYNLGFACYKLDRLEEAERYFNQAISIRKSDPDQYVYLGLTWMKMGRLDQAAAAIRRGIEIRPQAIGYHFALGSVFKRQGNLKAALEEFKAELVNNPKQTAARQQIEEIEARLNRGQAAN